VSVLVDTTVWSMALRNKKKDSRFLNQLIQTNQVRIIGAIRQELLSGIKDNTQFKKLRNHLTSFPDYPVTPYHYVKAAQLYNVCRTHGIQASHIDFLISAVAIEEDLELYTFDKDFEKIAELVPLRLLNP